MTNMKFPFSVCSIHPSIVESYRDCNLCRSIKADVNEDLIEFLKRMKQECVPRIFDYGVWQGLIDSIKNKHYLFGELNIVQNVKVEFDMETNATKTIKTLTFPDGSVVHDVISMLKEYGELFPFSNLDWTSADYESQTFDMHVIMKLTLNPEPTGQQQMNFNESICMSISFSIPDTQGESITYKNFFVEVRYINRQLNKFIVIYPFSNNYRTGFINPNIYQPLKIEILMKSIKQKQYLPGELNIINENGILLFPTDSVVHDAVQLLNEYCNSELYLFNTVDWAHAQYECERFDTYIKMKLLSQLNNNESVSMTISFAFPSTANESITYKNFIIDVNYRNTETQKFNNICLFSNCYRTGYYLNDISVMNYLTNNSSFNNLPSHFHIDKISWNYNNVPHRCGYYPASIYLRKNQSNGNTVTSFLFLQMGHYYSHNCKPSQIKWEQTSTGETVSVLYFFANFNINYFPLFAQLYPNQSYINNNQLKCFTEMANVFNSDEFQNVVLGLPWLAVQKRVVIPVIHPVTQLPIKFRKGHLELLNNDLLGLIFQFLFPELSLSFLVKMIELNVAKFNKRTNAF